MSDALVTLASFADPTEAALARNALEEAGIRAALSDETMVSMFWHMTGAVGGVKLLVAASDLVRAEALLAELRAEPLDGTAGHSTDAPAADGDQPDDEPGREPDDEDWPALSPREQDAERALKSAILGILFCPLQVYACWLLVKVFASSQPLAPRQRTRALVAGAICLPYVLVILCVVKLMLAGG